MYKLKVSNAMKSVWLEQIFPSEKELETKFEELKGIGMGFNKEVIKIAVTTFH